MPSLYTFAGNHGGGCLKAQFAYNEIMITLPEVFRGLSEAHPDIFVERAGGSAVAQLISRHGEPLEIGQQRKGFWLPSFTHPDYYGLFVGSQAKRRSLVIQRETLPVDAPVAETALRTTYLRGKKELAPRSLTVPLDRGVLGLQLEAIAGRALILDVEQAAEYNAAIEGLSEAVVIKHGLELYGQQTTAVGYLAIHKV